MEHIHPPTDDGVLICNSSTRRDPIVRRHAVSIKKHYPWSGAFRDAKVAGRTSAFFSFNYDADIGKLFSYGCKIIAGIVIRHDHFNVVFQLRHQSLETALQSRHIVEMWDNDSKLRWDGRHGTILSIVFRAAP